jgi:hypothetical protein
LDLKMLELTEAEAKTFTAQWLTFPSVLSIAVIASPMKRQDDGQYIARKNFSNMDYRPIWGIRSTMNPALSVMTPQRIATEAFTDAAAAVVRLDEIYERNTHFLRRATFKNAAAQRQRSQALRTFHEALTNEQRDISPRSRLAHY